jgi:single-strand selective monofunctional uracil DNA glycosylase
MTFEHQLIDAARELASQTGKLRFGAPISHVYNPLAYAWDAHEAYLRRFGSGRKQVIFLGMNPGPFGMAQTGVPFGEVAAVRDWMKIRAAVGHPASEHPRRPIHGFECSRSEVSGRRLWGLFGQRFGAAENFFADHFVVNYCPLVFMFDTGRNSTPDKLPTAEKQRLQHICDAHLKRVIEILRPKWVVGVGDFAARRAEEVFSGLPVRIGQILHPSPASPAANRDWPGRATAQLQALGIWK